MGAVIHSHLLPGGAGVLGHRIGIEGGIVLSAVGADTGRVLSATGFKPTYVDTGHILYLDQAGGLWALPFDAPAGEVRLRWHKHEETIRYRLTVPDGYEVKLENTSGRALVREP